MVYAIFGCLKGIFIRGSLCPLYGLFSFNEFIFLIAIAAILFSAGFIQFNSVNEKAKLLLVKNSLENWIEECLMRSSKNNRQILQILYLFWETTRDLKCKQ